MSRQWLSVMLSFDRMFLLLDNSRSDIRFLNVGRVLAIAFGLFVVLCGLNSFGFTYHLETRVTIDPIKNGNVTSILCVI
jgi:hypothetical protein